MTDHGDSTPLSRPQLPAVIAGALGVAVLAGVAAVLGPAVMAAIGRGPAGKQGIASQPAVQNRWVTQRRATFTPAALDAESAKTERCLRLLYPAMGTYRRLHDGQYPATLRELRAAVEADSGSFGLKWSDLDCSGLHFLDKDKRHLEMWEQLKLDMVHHRPDGTLVGGPLPAGKRDALIDRLFPSADIHDPRNSFALVLWDDGKVTRVPYRQWVKVPVPGTHRYWIGYPGQAGVTARAVAAAE